MAKKITREFLAKIPKTDLHLHLDGSLRLSTLIELAKAAKVPLPSETEAGLQELVFKEKYKDLPDYLQGFGLTCAVLQTPENLERVAYELALDNIAENVRYIEVRYAPQLHVRPGFCVEEVVASVNRGLARAKKEHNSTEAAVSYTHLDVYKRQMRRIPGIPDINAVQYGRPSKPLLFVSQSIVVGIVIGLPIGDPGFRAIGIHRIPAVGGGKILIGRAAGGVLCQRARRHHRQADQCQNKNKPTVGLLHGALLVMSNCSRGESKQIGRNHGNSSAAAATASAAFFWRMTVSYTHLDVYKRQGVAHRVRVKPERLRRKIAQQDVYKRQAITQSVAMGYRKTLQNLLTMARPQKSCNSLQYQQNHFKKSNG